MNATREVVWQEAPLNTLLAVVEKNTEEFVTETNGMPYVPYTVLTYTLQRKGKAKVRAGGV